MNDWIAKHLSSEDKDAISRAVANAEAKTSGEIVPMIVRRSVSTRPAPYIALMTMMSILFVAALSFHLDFSTHEHLYWLAGGAVLALVVAIATPFVEPLVKFFTLDADEADAAFARAQLEFYSTGIPSTENRTGVLIFVSLFERRAFVLGDKAISERMPADAWVEITQEMVTRLKSNDYRTAFVGAIEKIGSRLANEFPRGANDRDELANELIVKD